MRPGTWHDDSPGSHQHSSHAATTLRQGEVSEWSSDNAGTLEWYDARCCAEEAELDECSLNDWLEDVS